VSQLVPERLGTNKFFNHRVYGDKSVKNRDF
jgi:hypothetical protein